MVVRLREWENHGGLTKGLYKACNRQVGAVNSDLLKEEVRERLEAPLRCL
jgi:hypothetical protein